MRSKTSFFNKTIFTKTMGRFWPLWAAYLAAWLLILPVRLLSARNLGASAAAIKYILLDNGAAAGVVMALIFGGLAAMAVWSFLYTTRSAYGTACLPLRRETLFFSNVAAGLLPLLAANLLVAVFGGLAAAGALGGAAFGAAAQWFGAVTLMALFFFGFGTLCALLTGSVVIMPLVYAVLNFTAYVVEMLVRVVLSVFVFGFGMNASASGYVVRWLSPAVGYFSAIGTDAVYGDFVAEDGEIYTSVVDYTFYGWGAIVAYAVVGIVLLALALLLLRRRRMETAGEVVAVSPLKPVFRWCMALGCGLVLANIMYGVAPVSTTMGAFAEMLIFMIVGAFVGWFAAQMLMKKSFRVFKGGWSGWAGFGLCCAVILALMLGMRFDLFGYERYVPAEEKVESVWLNADGEYVRLTEPENIARLRALHESIIADKDEHTRENAPYESRGGVYCYLEYKLSDDRNIARTYQLRYDLDDPSGDAVALQELLNVPEAIADRKRTDFPFTPETVVYGSVDATITIAEAEADPTLLYRAGAAGYYYDDEYARTGFVGVSYTLSAAEAWELYSTCVVPDFEDGTLGKIWIVHNTDYETSAYDASIYISAERENADGSITHNSIRTVPTVDSRRTNAWLEAHGVALHLVGETE